MARPPATSKAPQVDAAAAGSPSMDPGALVNLKQAARRLGVHYMTAYQYVRQGRLEAFQEGTTWLVPSTAIERLLSERTGAAQRPRAALLGPGRHVDWADRLYACLLAGDEASAWRVVRSALAAGRSLTFCYAEMLNGALEMLGASWAAGEISIADQYVATAVASRIVARLGAVSRRPGRSRGTVVFGAPLGELHALPVSIAADLVRAAGFSVLELGASVPAEAFALAVRRAPRLVAVGIGVSSGDWLASAQQAIDAVRAVNADVPIVLGGQAAITAAGSELRGATAWVPDGPSAVAVIEGFAQVSRNAGATESTSAPHP